MLKVAKACAWSGPAMLALATVGFLIAGVLPKPLSPGASQAATVAFYTAHPDHVRAGFVIASLGLGLIFPLVVLITLKMMRIEGRTPLLSFIQLITGGATGVLLLIPILVMTIASFRPAQDPHVIVALSDLGWLLFITPIAPFMIQNVSIGLAVLMDRSPAPVMPRWVGYFNFCVAAMFIPDVLAFFFKHGPLAWNGILIFWLAFAAYAAFILVMGVVLRNPTDLFPSTRPSTRIAEPATT